MLVFWRIRYLDTRDKKFKDRDLYLDTDSLEPVPKAAVELCLEVKASEAGREILRYRHLFQEQAYSPNELNALCDRYDGGRWVSLHDYFEDENGNELTSKQMAVALSGSPTAVMFPAGTPNYEVEFVLAEHRPIPIDEVALSADDLNILGYFARDIREMLASAFYKEGPGTLTNPGTSGHVLQTAVSDEEIRSFVTIFRRLYMENEPANFQKAVEVFAQAVGDYPLVNWIKGVANEYEADLNSRPDFIPFAGRENWNFTRKRLIDVFLYTRYAHQPDARRSRQYQECLNAVGGKNQLLMWLFLAELWQCSMHIHNAGKIIAAFFDCYCQHHAASPAVLASVAQDNPGIGSLEKKDEQRGRVFREKSQELAETIWRQNGRPEGGPAQFIRQAREQLQAAIEGQGHVRDDQIA